MYPGYCERGSYELVRREKRGDQEDPHSKTIADAEILEVDRRACRCSVGDRLVLVQEVGGEDWSIMTTIPAFVSTSSTLMS
jgi:hypothetical protein